MATTIKPRDSSTTIAKIRHQDVTYELNTRTIGKNISIFHIVNSLPWFYGSCHVKRESACFEKPKQNDKLYHLINKE
jgi:hypothetical protein